MNEHAARAVRLEAGQMLFAIFMIACLFWFLDKATTPQDAPEVVFMTALNLTQAEVDAGTRYLRAGDRAELFGCELETGVVFYPSTTEDISRDLLMNLQVVADLHSASEACAVSRKMALDIGAAK